jgi:phosphodiesterase/alkaline phosphatase D-like protein
MRVGGSIRVEGDVQAGIGPYGRRLARLAAAIVAALTVATASASASPPNGTPALGYSLVQNAPAPSSSAPLQPLAPTGPPTVVTEPASSITSESAVLHATVNPNGSAVIECTFEYGTTTAYVSHQPCSSLPGSGESPVPVSLSLKGLGANTTYHFRISAANAGGTSLGLDQTFTTLPVPPAVTTCKVEVTSTTARLCGTVNPHGGEVAECRFEFGTTTAYGSNAPCTPPPGSGTSPVEVHAEIAGLTPNTTYHFRIVATNAGGQSTSSDQTFTTLVGAPTVVTEPATAVKVTSATPHATVNPNEGDVSECKFEYGTTTAYGSSRPCSSLPGAGNTPVAVSATVKGLAPNTTYHFRISATNPGGTSKGADETLKTLEASAPTVVTAAASSITQTSASVSATVNPNESEVSECKFEYGTTTAYGSGVPCSSLPGSGESPVAVSAAVTGLAPNTTYHFRISATNPGGTSKGADETFKTLEVSPPAVVTTLASAITQTAATLNGTVNPNGSEVSECKFEWGTTTAYGSSAPCSSLPGSEGSPVAVSAPVAGLAANTTYHFRIFATNGRGSSTGADKSFKTLPNPPTVVTEPASSVGESSATLHATVNPNGGEVAECKFEYGTTTAYGSSVPCMSSPGSGESPVAVSGALKEGQLGPGTTYHFRISATNSTGTSTGADQAFTTGPAVATKAASSIGETSATLNASVNPNGHEVSACSFEYGTTTAYGKTAPCSPSPGSGTTAVAVAASVTVLSVNTAYHFRISASNAEGTSTGADETFSTLARPPSVLSAAASSIKQTSATLNATVNPEGKQVSACTFEWGTTSAYGSSAPCSALPGAGETPVAVSAPLSGLSNKTSYHFRITATSAEGQSRGVDRTFTAASAHVYKNGTMGAEGKPVRTIAWGTLKLTNASLGEVECHTVSAGYLENPAGGGSALGKVQGFVPYECVSASCTSLGGSASEVTPEALPWSTEAIEAEGGAMRIRSGNRVRAAGADLVRVNCVGKVSGQFVGEAAPKFLTGLEIGAVPTEEEFDQPGSGELESEANGGLKSSGKLKVQGYGAQELLEVKNP